MKYYPLEFGINPSGSPGLSFRDIDALQYKSIDVYLPDFFADFESIVKRMRAMLLAAFEKDPSLKNIQPPPLRDGDIVLCIEEEDEKEHSSVRQEDSDWEWWYPEDDEYDVVSVS